MVKTFELIDIVSLASVQGFPLIYTYIKSQLPFHNYALAPPTALQLYPCLHFRLVLLYLYLT